jgi:hypothetical protein
MFAPAYFAPRYFAPRYFGPSADVAESVNAGYFAPSYFAPRYFAPGYFPPGIEAEEPAGQGYFPPVYFAPNYFAPFYWSPGTGGTEPEPEPDQNNGRFNRRRYEQPRPSKKARIDLVPEKQALDLATALPELGTVQPKADLDLIKIRPEPPIQAGQLALPDELPLPDFEETASSIVLTALDTVPSRAERVDIAKRKQRRNNALAILLIMAASK